jgi:hypothetical protein
MPPAPESSQPDFDEARRKADEFARTAHADVFARYLLVLFTPRESRA